MYVEMELVVSKFSSNDGTSKKAVNFFVLRNEYVSIKDAGFVETINMFPRNMKQSFKKAAIQPAMHSPAYVSLVLPCELIGDL
jgi:hypothetical protein